MVLNNGNKDFKQLDLNNFYKKSFKITTDIANLQSRLDELKNKKIY